jgi:S1-C subfamily serine protease
MSINEPNDLSQFTPEAGRESGVDESRPAGGAPLWRPEANTAESAAPPEPPAQPDPWSAPANPWSAPVAPAYPAPPQYTAQQYPVPLAPMPQYQPWSGTPAPGWPIVTPRNRDGGARRLWPVVVGVALLSASLSAAGTYFAISLTARAVASPVATGQPAIAEQITLTQSDAIVRVASQVKPSVVTIMTTDNSNVSPYSLPATGAGSGFIVTAGGLILTNNHVVTGTSSLTVILDDTRQLPATIVATDPQHDLALIKVDATGLTPVRLGDSSGIQVGQLAIAIGSPLGTFTDSVTQGIVSGTNRSIAVGDRATGTEENLSGLIQTDAAINPGNSGGPLLDAGGAVVGIITASASNAQDVGFAIPINQAKVMIAAATK